MGDGEPSACGDVGETPLGVCEFDAAAEPVSESSGAREPFRDLAPMRLFLSLNFSIQLALVATWPSGLLVVAAKVRALSLIMSSDRGRPFLSWFFALQIV